MHYYIIVTLISILVSCSNAGDNWNCYTNGEKCHGDTENPDSAGGPSVSGPRGPAGNDGKDGADGKDGTDGRDGADGKDGADGASIETSTIIISGIDRTNGVPWEDHHKHSSTRTGYIVIPVIFYNYALPSTNAPNGGWVDICVGPATYCFQRNSNAYSYSFKYRKVPGHLLGCDSNSEKYAAAYSLTATIEPGTIIQVIPRDPKLAGVVWSLEFTTVVSQEN